MGGELGREGGRESVWKASGGDEGEAGEKSDGEKKTGSDWRRAAIEAVKLAPSLYLLRRSMTH